MLIYIVSISIVSIFVFGIVSVSRTLRKIRVSREQGRNIAKKNSYYKFLSSTFLNLPS